jgi:type VI secretion system protein ImpG
MGRSGVRTYATRYRQSPGKRELYLSVGGDQLAAEELPEETLSIEAWCSNGVLPREEIREGGVGKGGSGFPDYVMLSNISRPTLPCRPPDEDSYLWAFLSHLGGTLGTLASVDALKALLRLYDWSGAGGRTRRIDAIAEVSSAPVEKCVAGSIVRGIELTVTIAEAQFHDSSDLHLFGEVLGRFLSYYVTINSFLRLVFVLRPSGTELRWDSLEGRRWPV